MATANPKEKGRRETTSIYRLVAPIPGSRWTDSLRWRNWTLKLKLIVIIGSLLMVAIGLISFSAVTIAGSAQAQQIDFFQKMVANIFSKTTVVHFGNPRGGEVLQLNLNTIFDDEDVKGRVVGAVAVDDKLKVLASYPKNNVIGLNGIDLKEVKAPKIIKIRSDLITVAAPALYDGQVDGFILFEFSKAYAQNAKNKIVLQMSAITVTALIVFIILTFLVSQSISKRIVILRRAIQEMKNGNLDYPIDLPKGNDEVDQFTTSLTEFREMQRTVKKYLHQELAQLILNGTLQEIMIERKLIILFADVKGYTKLSAHYRSAIVAELNDVFSIIQAAALDFNGFIAKPMGDGLMLWWGLKGKRLGDTELTKQDGEQAFMGAFAIQFLLHFKAFAKGELENQFPLIFRFGLGTGPVMFGPYGADDFKDFTSIGDTVNVASRIEGVARPGQIATDHHIQLNTGETLTDEEADEATKRGEKILEDPQTGKKVRPIVDIAASDEAWVKNVEKPVKLHHLASMASAECNKALRQYIWDFMQRPQFRERYVRNLQPKDIQKFDAYVRKFLGVDDEGRLIEEEKKLVLPAPRKSWFPPEEKPEKAKS